MSIVQYLSGLSEHDMPDFFNTMNRRGTPLCNALISDWFHGVLWGTQIISELQRKQEQDYLRSTIFCNILSIRDNHRGLSLDDYHKNYIIPKVKQNQCLQNGTAFPIDLQVFHVREQELQLLEYSMDDFFGYIPKAVDYNSSYVNNYGKQQFANRRRKIFERFDVSCFNLSENERCILYRYCNIYVLFTNHPSPELFDKVFRIMLVEESNYLLDKQIANQLIVALDSNNGSMFKNTVNQIFGALMEKIRQAKILQDIMNFKQKYMQNHTQDIQNSINSINNDIATYERELGIFYAKLKELMIKQSSSLYQEIESGVTEMIDYITNTYPNDISLCNGMDGYRTMEIGIRSVLTFFDEEIYKNYKTGRRNFITERNESEIRVLDAIFIDKIAEVHFNTSVNLYFVNDTNVTFECNKQRSRDKGFLGMFSLPHPHLYHYNCWGDNKPLVSKAFRDNDYILAFEQIRSVLMSITTTDIAVFQKFVNDMFDNELSDRACIKDKETGNMYTPRNYATYLVQKSQNS